jgi:hypothetical protein
MVGSCSATDDGPYVQQGFEREYIQGLMGHADEKMTEHYQAGHGNEAVVYMKVKADLKV